MFAMRAAVNTLRNNTRMKHKLPELPYDYKALEPIICAEIMNLHHTKHHGGYVANLNVAEEKYMEAKAKNDVTAMISLQPAIRFNGGGHINHSILWHNLTPERTSASPEFCKDVERDFGSVAEMQKQMSNLVIGIQGSGWGWLGYNKTMKRLQLAACANQDPLQGTTGLIPLLGIDVWEHAYYIQYKNVRPDYVKAIWDIINWKDVSERLAKAKSS